jgi:hypothetical protein
VYTPFGAWAIAPNGAMKPHAIQVYWHRQFFHRISQGFLWRQHETMDDIGSPAINTDAFGV